MRTGSGCWTAMRITRPRSRPTWRRPVISPTAAGSSRSSSRTCSAGPASSLAEFGAALGLADEVIVMDIYAAREDPEPGVTGRLVADAVPAGRARYVPDAAQVPAVITEIAKPGDVVLTMGAGDVTKLGPVIVAAPAGPGERPVNSPGPGLTTPESGAAAAADRPAPSPARARSPWRTAFFGLAAVGLVAGIAWALLGVEAARRPVRRDHRDAPRARQPGAGRRGHRDRCADDPGRHRGRRQPGRSHHPGAVGAGQQVLAGPDRDHRPGADPGPGGRGAGLGVRRPGEVSPSSTPPVSWSRRSRSSPPECPPSGPRLRWPRCAAARP